MILNQIKKRKQELLNFDEEQLFDYEVGRNPLMKGRL